MSLAPNVRDLLEGHIGLELESIDRLYLNGYVPQLQHGAGLVGFLCQQHGKPIASPALPGQITGRFIAEVKAFAKEQGIPLFHFERNESKDQRAHQLRRERPVHDAVVFIGIAQEKAYAFTAHRLPSKGATFEFTRNKSVLPNDYYFYLDDADWGESFIKVCSYAPWGLKLYLNGHEWHKRQLTKEGISFESLDNGFLSCQNPERLQELANALGPQQIQSFLVKWLDRLPMPLWTHDRAAGYDYRLSIWQMEFSLTQIVDRPLRGRQFFEELIRDNLDLGRPDRIQLIFPRKIIRTTPGSFRTRVLAPAGSRARQPKLWLERRKHPTGGATDRDPRRSTSAGLEIWRSAGDGADAVALRLWLLDRWIAQPGVASASSSAVECRIGAIQR